MHHILKALCYFLLMVECFALLWLAKLLADKPSIESFYDGARAVFHTMFYW